MKTISPFLPRWLVAAATVLLLGLPALPASAQSPAMETEIDYLIEQVGRDRCNFIRNDRPMLGREAREHLQSKRERNAALFSSTEEFIEKIASRSETTGQPYLIRCARRFQLSSEEWMTMLLEHYREDNS
ncbi:MAG: DUF5329 family protein [Gammaproteobacteria bacterium]